MNQLTRIKWTTLKQTGKHTDKWLFNCKAGLDSCWALWCLSIRKAGLQSPYLASRFLPFICIWVDHLLHITSLLQCSAAHFVQSTDSPCLSSSGLLKSVESSFPPPSSSFHGSQAKAAPANSPIRTSSVPALGRCEQSAGWDRGARKVQQRWRCLI